MAHACERCDRNVLFIDELYDNGLQERAQMGLPNVGLAHLTVEPAHKVVLVHTCPERTQVQLSGVGLSKFDFLAVEINLESARLLDDLEPRQRGLLCKQVDLYPLEHGVALDQMQFALSPIT